MRILKYIYLPIIGIILTLLIGEFIFYVVPYLNRKYSWEKFIVRFTEISWIDGDTDIYRPSNLLGYERIPNCRPDVNSFGLIGEQFSLRKPRNTFRILVLGDSIAAQNYFVQYLKEMLNNCRYRKRFEVINAGVGSYEIWHYARFLKYRGIKFKPDLVLISFCLDDLDKRRTVLYRVKGAYGFMKFEIPTPQALNAISPNIWLFRHSYVYRLFILTFDKLLSHGEDYTDKMEGIHQLSVIKDICRNNDIPVFAVIWPYLLPLAEYEDWMQEQYTRLLDVVNQVGIECIDLHKYLPDNQRVALRLNPLQDDYIHPNEKGHRIVSEVIFDYLKKNLLERIQ